MADSKLINLMERLRVTHEKVRKSLFKYTHSEKTGYLLNYFSLRIANTKLSDEVKE